MTDKEQKKDKPTRKVKQVYLSESGDEERKVTVHVAAKPIKNDDEDDTKIYDPRLHGDRFIENHYLEAHEERSRHGRGLRIALIAVVLVLSMIMSSAVGVALALWDSNKTVSDLAGVLFPSVVMAATPDIQQTSEKSSEAQSEQKVAKEETSKKPKSKDNNTDKVNKSSEKDTKESLEETLKKYIEENKQIEENSQIEAEDSSEAEEIDDDNNIEEEPQEIDEPVIDEETGEISGIESYVKAGQEDELVSFGGDMVTTAAYADPNTNYPYPISTVDESYFTDALFIGDSRMQGFGLWSGLPATFYCATGFQLYKIDTTNVVQTENGKVPIFDALPYDAFTKIYIKVGLNEMGWGNEEKFEELYASVIARLREREPRAIIYIHGLLPVTAEKSSTDKSHNNVNISNRNAALAEFAVTQKAYFVNAGEALAGADGCLPSEMTADGIHLKSQYMPIWKEYLLKHAAVMR